MYFSSIGRSLFVAALSMLAMPAAAAAPIGPEAVVGDIMQLFEASQISDTILEAAKSLFWSLALISLVWTMGMLIVRQDIGELLMELLRFIIVTGLFYWVLVNASSRQGGQGFVEDIVMSFLGMVNDQASDESIRKSANDILARCLHVFFMVINETADGQDADRLIVGAMVTMIVCIGAVMAAQFLIALVMAWILGYAGIFLLGFGGARWTSPIAVNYYKHVLAVGVAMLALSLIGAITSSFIDELGLSPNGRVYSKFDYLGLMLAVMILMQALAIKVPQLLYTLVTGSTLGLYAGSANAAGTAIAAAGNSAYSTAFSRPHGGGGAGGSGAPLGPSGGSPGHRTESVMDAVQRSASAAGGMADPFHVHSGADPFGVRRAPDPLRGRRGGSVFGNASAGAEVPATVVEPSADAAGVSEISASGTRDAHPVGRHDRGAANESTTRPAGGSVPATKGPRVIGSHSGGGVDTGVERGTADRGIKDAIVHEQHSASVSGQQNASGQAVDDLRARTLSASEPSIEARIDTSATVREEPRSVVDGVPPGSGQGIRRGSSLSEVPPRSMPHPGMAPAAEHSDDRLPVAGHAERKANATDVRHATSPVKESALHETEVHGAHAGASATRDRHTVDSTTPLPNTEVNDAQRLRRGIHGHDVSTVEVRHGGEHGTTDLATGIHTASVHNPDAHDSVVRRPDMRSMQFVTARQPVEPGLVDRHASPTTAPSRRKTAEVPAVSVAQEDMKTTRSTEEVQVLLPGATVETPVPPDAPVLTDTADASAEMPTLGPKRHRMRRKPDDAPSTMPPVDSDEPSEEGEP